MLKCVWVVKIQLLGSALSGSETTDTDTVAAEWCFPFNAAKR